MAFRQAVTSDDMRILAILEGAKRHLRAMGVDQWQTGYPDLAAVRGDIDNGEAYVLEEGDDLAAAFTLSFRGEPSYATLNGGEWENNGEYGVVHRMAIADAFRGAGLSARLFAEIERLCRAKGVGGIKADTHPDNKQMQRLLEKHSYVFRGTIFFDGGDKLAYEKAFSRPKH